MRLVRLVESEDTKTDKLIDAVLRIYKDELTDDEIVRLVSNLRKQAKDIVNSREKVDVMINPDENKIIHDWEDQVTTDKSPVTDDTEIIPAKKVSNPDASEDEVEEPEESEAPEDLENDPDYDEKEESEDNPEESEEDEEKDSEEKPAKVVKKSSKKKRKKPEKETSKDEAPENEEEPESEEKNEGFRLVRFDRRFG